MLTANRIHEFFNSAFEWEDLIRRETHRPTNSYAPRIAVGSEAVLVEVDLPGIDRESLDVEVLKNTLSIGFENTGPNADEGTWKLRERAFDRDRLEFSFPFDIDVERSNLELKDGVLKIELQKPAEDAPRKLNVK